MMNREDSPKTKEEYHSLTDGVTLPDWMKDIKEDAPVFKVTVSKDSYGIENRDEKFDELESAYDYIQDDLDGIPDLSEVSSSLLFTKSNRLLLSHTPQDRLRLQRYSYLEFLNLNSVYENNPDDFYTSYHWIRSHPALYYRFREDNGWEQEDGLHALGTLVIKGENDEVKILLELGTSSGENRVGEQTYLDFRLDSWGETYEEAIVTLASKINKHFTTDGVDRGMEEKLPPFLAKALKSAEEYESKKE